MFTLVTVEMVSGRFRGRASDQNATAWPPSPARVVGAILAGAHNLEGADPDSPTGLCAQAREALRTLTAAPYPTISAPEEPIEFSGNRVTWYTPRHPLSDEDSEDHFKGHAVANGSPNADLKKSRLRRIVALPEMLDTGNRTAKTRTVSILPQGRVVHFLVDAQITDDEQWDALTLAAGNAAFFGASTDHAVITAQRAVEVMPSVEGSVVWKPSSEAGSRGARRIRGWTPTTVEWFDDSHRTGGGKAGDWRVPEVDYLPTTAPVADTPADTCVEIDVEVKILPIAKAITLPEFAAVVASVPEWANVKVFPAIEFGRADRVRGFGLYGEDLSEALDAAEREGLSGVDARAALRSWQPATWTGPSVRWVSATPIAAHLDPMLARTQIITELHAKGMALTSMSRHPFLRWQPRHTAIPAPYGRWFITAESSNGTPLAGPIHIGAHNHLGAGILAPAPTERADRR